MCHLLIDRKERKSGAASVVENHHAPLIALREALGPRASGAVTSDLELFLSNGVYLDTLFAGQDPAGGRRRDAPQPTCSGGHACGFGFIAPSFVGLYL